MKKLAALVPALLLAAACGSDTKSCETAAAPLAAVASSCTLAAGANVRIAVRAACGSCAETSPSCVGELLGSDIELNPVYRICQEDRGCPNTGCNFDRFDCTFTAPPVSGQYTLVYPTQNGGLGQANVTVQSGGSTSCSLALAEDPAPAP